MVRGMQIACTTKDMPDNMCLKTVDGGVESRKTKYLYQHVILAQQKPSSSRCRRRYLTSRPIPSLWRGEQDVTASLLDPIGTRARGFAL